MHEQNFEGTKRLYYEDSMMWEFDSTVLSSFLLKGSMIEKAAAAYPDATHAVEFEASAFFPEGGGQAGDEGLIYQSNDGDDINPNALIVYYTVEKDGIIYHLTNGEIAPGEKVHAKINKGLRFERMQQHTGEHIVSGLVHQKYGYENVGFHLGAEFTTLDFNGPLTKDQVSEIELQSNEAVYENILVKTFFPTKEEEEKIEYRSKLDIEGQVRLVEIPGVDMCACCAPHVVRTGEVGIIKVVDITNYKGGTRLSILCGSRALKDYARCEEVVKLLSQRLSVPTGEVKDATEAMLTQSENRRVQVLNWQEKYILSSSANEEKPSEDALLRFEEDLDTDIARKYVNAKLQNSQTKIAGIFIGSDENGFRYIIGSEEINLRDLSKLINEKLNGKGGGKPEMIQGQVAKSKEEIVKFFNTLGEING